MALSDDQKAILRLLSQRGEQGYEDLSALLGVSVGEVHSRAKAAAAQLESEGIPAPVIPEPGGGGGGGSPSVATDGEAPPGEPPPPETPPTVPAEPQEPAPEVVHSTEAPRARAKDAEPKLALPKGEPRPPLGKELKLLEGRGLWAILAGVAIVVLFVVFIFAGGDDGGDGDTTTTSSNAPSGETVAALEKAAEGGNREVTKAALEAVDDSGAIGVAIFGRVKKSLALQVAAEGLEPTGEGESYTIWLSASAQKMLPLASTEVGEDGRIGAQVEVPVEVLAYLANETFRDIAITRTDDSQLRASLAQATKDKDAPVYTGDEVLRGEVTGPIVGAANRQTGK
ncbi:MAG TPA: Lrp/AsnC family transcriptional regulator [Solirubrobacterales bacterium]|nr:Lrp/AsnC family transcriptional regulator [Solirubrobacterales bacterium]